MLRKIKPLFITFGFAVMVVMQISLFSNIFWLSFVSPLIITLVFVGVIHGFRYPILFSLAIGPIVDLFSPIFFGAITLSWLFVFWLLDKFFHKVFTNKSYYSIVTLVTFALILEFILKKIFWFFENIIRYQQFDFSIFSSASLQHIVFIIILNFIVTSLSFIVYYLFSNKFKSVLINT
ncbi:hypothetical protein A2533_02015 [Candidatus Falkowbacteria bacterium RIFOXYD2_FULL_35_9]|uniref:Rod shape-determining protein MreD n=1 Tax=Candidatus Falkowbacteria bacterium RIFOXYC2_FULL_36_12 TaxID=1798002 RepID=A0A1F5SY92_9BACT|nr:MAG: hypothetical protein A2478_04000 [Candidatus Falkowbacteria bacterium RIFOXYC2_FULL_36_12]OGF33918.1 MAG: hypothetical protein A2223_03010 [Candidatus Falkowbacteria bacterium RIFOXYA2_FULL_35_8]OGF46892.1 MAG: hypothetical protein A2533_02015 [Candidatus Falkowbacteria bacterium RIFOXYD2_FULL_35_9]